MSSNVTCSRHDITENLLIWRYIHCSNHSLNQFVYVSLYDIENQFVYVSLYNIDNQFVYVSLYDIEMTS